MKLKFKLFVVESAQRNFLVILALIFLSDVHYIDDWSFAPFPICPGHEIVGKVVKAGDTVKTLKVGDRVGIGGQRDSCGTCEYCLQGDENLCPSVIFHLLLSINLRSLLEHTLLNILMERLPMVDIPSQLESTRNLPIRFQTIYLLKVKSYFA